MTQTIATATYRPITAHHDGGLTIKRHFTSPDVHPFDEVEWEIRDAVIEDNRPDAPTRYAFEQRGVEFPKTWSQTATMIVAQKYFRGRLGTPEREHSVRQIIERVAGTLAAWGWAGGYFNTSEDRDAYHDELCHLLVNQIAAFNSPVWFNAGVESSPMCHACYILAVNDTFNPEDPDNIAAWNTKEGAIFRGGSGAGINLSKIRGSMEHLSAGGTASGPLSFAQGTDAWAGVIKSGGKTRRAAKMLILDADHPDILEFIDCKAEQEEIAAVLRDLGHDMRLDSKTFNRNVMFQNANNTVRLTDRFMACVENDEDWDLIARNTKDPDSGEKKIVKTVRARDIMARIAAAAHRCADPGVQFDDTINAFNTCANTDRIYASNPCSEYMHLNNTGCNLSSLNLMAFGAADRFDIDAFVAACELMQLSKDILIGTAENPACGYPTNQIRDNSWAMRQTGIGYSNLGGLLMASGLAYDSREARDTAAAITALMTACAYRLSGTMAACSTLGPYELYAENKQPHDHVITRHADAAQALGGTPIAQAAKELWEQVGHCCETTGFRNAQVSVLAPTGTISFLMDCATTGIEPDFSLVKYKELVGGGQLKIVNPLVETSLNALGYTDKQAAEITAHVLQETGGVARGTVAGAPHLSEQHYPVFDCAVGDSAISPQGHLQMMAACQPFLSGAISKTINLPHHTTIDDIQATYIAAWKLGLKAVALYRDGSKTAQALSTTAAGTTTKRAYTPDEVGDLVSEAARSAPPRRQRMPIERESMTAKLVIGGHEGYITAGYRPDGQLGEIFLTDIGKEGSTLRGMMNAFATSISIALQYGVPLENLVEKFAYMRFEPEGATGNPAIPFAKSLPDYIMRWLAYQFCSTEFCDEQGIHLTDHDRVLKAQGSNRPLMAARREHDPTRPITIGSTNGSAAAAPPVRDEGMLCAECGGTMLRTGACHSCLTCGTTSGCG